MLTLGGPIIMPVQWVSSMSSSFSRPQDMVPSPTPFWPWSSSSRSRKLLGIETGKRKGISNKVTKFQHCWNSCIGKKYIFRHEFGVFFGISNSLISLHFTWKSGQKSCQTSDFPTLCIYMYYDWRFIRKSKCYQCKLYLWTAIHFATDKKIYFKV